MSLPTSPSFGQKALALLALGLLLGCGPDQQKDATQHRGDRPLKVLSSFSIISDMASAIGQERVEVHNLVPVGMAPHSYEPKPADVKFASDADLILYNGLQLEGGEAGWLMKLARSVQADTSRIFRVSEGVRPMYLTNERIRREMNPHAFISPEVGIAMAKATRDAFIAVDPAGQALYTARATAYIAELQRISQAYRDSIARIPAQRRVLMASERAFQYLAAEYGLQEGFIWALDTDENGSPEQIKQAIALVEKHRPPVLFMESNVDRRPMEAVSRATGVPIHETPIFSDELGKPGQPADTYLKYLEYNLQVICSGLR